MNITPQQMRELEADALAALQEAIDAGRITMRIPVDEQRDTDLRIAKALAALRTAADQLEAVQKLLSEAHDKFAATYDAERMIGSGPSSIGVAGAPLALSVQRALGLLRAKATANIERLTAETAPQEDRDE